MKFLMALLVLSISTSTFAAGAWNIKCSAAKDIEYTEISGAGKLSVGLTDYSVSFAYDNKVESNDAVVKFLGDRKVLSEKYDEACNATFVDSKFTQKASVKVPGGKPEIVHFTCTEELFISGSEFADCSYDEI